MLQPDEKEKLEQGFAEAEASLRLEGLTPTDNLYAVKARILAGEITFEQGKQEILAYHRTKVPAVA
ncbi:MAG TPA: antitoxin VbhA family protein [Terracidiphilus sp.]|nr:antitoxin VbhA family protein [Terracidiphilus sp.]